MTEKKTRSTRRAKADEATVVEVEQNAPEQDVAEKPEAEKAEPCNVEGCERDAQLRGLCGAHHATRRGDAKREDT